MNRTKEFEIKSYNICVSIKANTAKQAINSFTKKYSAILSNTNYFNVSNSQLDTVGVFTLENHTMKDCIVLPALESKNIIQKRIIRQLKAVGVSCRINKVNFKDFIIVPLSGGKDSQACYELAQKKHKNVIAVFCDTKFEHPITYHHVYQLTKGKPFIYLNSGSIEESSIKNKRFAGGGSRHCTDALKIRPSKFLYKYLSSAVGGFDVWYGMRTNESHERAVRYSGKLSNEYYAPNDFMSNYPKVLADNGVRFRLPIVDLTTAEVFDIIQDRANPLYKAGFDRVGCFPCTASGDKNKIKSFLFDAIGAHHYKVLQNISVKIEKPIFTSKKFGAINDGSEFEGCSICSI